MIVLKYKIPAVYMEKSVRENFPMVSDYRNPFIAEAMKILGYVNRFSRGVYRVQKELTETAMKKPNSTFHLSRHFG